MRILFVLEYYHPHVGGMETLFNNLADSLDREGHQVTVITNRHAPHLSRREKIGNITIRRYPFGNRYLFTLLAFFPVIRYALHHDLIHTTSYNAGLPAFLAAKITGRQVAITFHEVWADLWLSLPYLSKWKGRLFRAFERLLLNLSFDVFAAPSQSTAHALSKAGVRQSKITMIYNGIDYDKIISDLAVEEQPVKDEKFKFIYFGRLGISKGLDILLPAVYLLTKRTTNFSLTLVIPHDNSTIFQHVNDSISQLEIESFVQLQHDLPAQKLFHLVRSAGAVIIPSYSEGFCFTAVESMALKIPIVSSQRGALREVVSGQFIAYDRQHPEALMLAMEKAIDGDWETSERRTFPLADAVNKYLDLYRKLMQK